MAATGQPVTAAASMLTSAVPDQIEFIVPGIKHRGSSHWLVIWFIVAAASILLPIQARLGHGSEELFRQIAVVGLAVGPLLHCAIDGCLVTGVAFGPFVRRKFRLRLYRTKSQRSGWSMDFSQGVFLAGLFVMSCVVWWYFWVPKLRG